MPNTPLDLSALIELDYGDFDEDLEFYENFARRGEGPLLELGVGTGRAAIPLAEAGFEVWGIDNDEAMLARADTNATAEASERLHLQQADMRDFHLDQQFSLVFAGFGAFHHLLTTDDQERSLRCVREHLRPGGLFICDLRPLLEDEWEFGESTPLFHDWTRILPDTRETVMRSHTVRADGATQIKRQTNIYDVVDSTGVVRRAFVDVDLRFTTRYEMEGLLVRTGLELDAFYGDFDLTPYDDASEYMITVARRPEEAS
jgi:SAM-dependent methyltransferase